MFLFLPPAWAAMLKRSALLAAVAAVAILDPRRRGSAKALLTYAPDRSFVPDTATPQPRRSNCLGGAGR